MTLQTNDNWIAIRKLQATLVLLALICTLQVFILVKVVKDGNALRNEKVDLGQLRKLNTLLQRNSRNYRNPVKRSVKMMPSLNKPQFVSKRRCETVHVAIVCGGYNSARATSTLIKSVLFFRRNPLHFHFIVDDKAKLILETLFTTWGLPEVEVSFYSVDDAIPSVIWIKTIHYSGRFGLVKLALPDLLPSHLNQVIILDTDVTLNTDITKLWKMFSEFSSTQVIGLVENQSDWYLYRDLHWPALGRGFNTGVVLLALERLRTIQWRQLWTDIAIRELYQRKFTDLADQDVLNAVIKEKPLLVYRIPCTWNVQLSERTLSEMCYGQGEQPRIVHWNSFRKDAVRSKHQDFFRKLYLTFAEYDGSLLRKELLGCTSSKRISVRMENYTLDLCVQLQEARNTTFRTHLYFLPFYYVSVYNSSDVTLVTQLTYDRLQMLDSLAGLWSGPMSVALYGSDTEAQSLVQFVSSSRILKKRRNIAFHVVYKERTRSVASYPVNYLRNIAFEQVVTPFLFLIDVDFACKPGLHHYLTQVISNMSMTMDSKKALVIPAFESYQHKFSTPTSKKSLILLWEKNIVSPFRFTVWKAGHVPVNYTRWKTEDKPYKVEWQKYFEPYMVISKLSPRYDKRFVGFGWNKVSHAMELGANRYEFIVLPEAFIVHIPHAPSSDNIQFRNDYNYRECMSKIKDTFIQDLKAKYGIDLNGTRY